MPKIYPNSDPLTSVFVPYSFEPKLKSTTSNTLVEGEDFEYQFDTIGRQSIIKLKTVPYIDLYYYDHNRRRWYYVDEYNNRFSVYTRGDYILETCSNFNVGINPTFPNIQFKYQANGIDLNLRLYKFNDESLWGTTSQGIGVYPINPYKPISISINSEQLKDITDYSTDQVVNPTLDEITPSRNRQFYYDFNNTIYTNQDFGTYNSDDIVISFYTNINKLNVKFRMNTNSVSLSNRTPIVDYYILKLTGQNL